ncbi:MAG: putative F420-0 ABC transporter substrate-binding protein [Microbacteriaceae bacterium]
MSRSRLIPALALGAASLVLAGCAGAAPAAEPSDDASAEAVTVENCGVEVSFDAAPSRVLTIKSTSTEMLLALGLGDRIIGTAFQDGPVPEQWADAASGLTEVSDKVPGNEVVLDSEPDMVYAGWESNFSADGAGERSELQALGVSTYVSPAACRSADVPEQLSFDDVFREIEEVASIFRVDAATLVDEQRAELDAIQPAEGSPTALWFSSGSDTPYVGGGIGAPQLVMSTAGLENIAADIDQAWSPYNWEAVIDADPDVLVLVDSDWNTAENKIGILEANPATAELTAVREGSYVIVPFAASEAGVRSVEAAASIADQLAEIGY